MTFRPANINDLSVLNQISILSKKHWGYPDAWIAKWKPDMMLDEKDLAEQSITVAVADNRQVGFCAVMEDEDKYEVMHLWLLPEFMGQGFGKELLEVALDNTISRPKSIIVESDPNAEAFYEKQGFVTFDKIESYPPGRYLPVMRKEN